MSVCIYMCVCILFLFYFILFQLRVLIGLEFSDGCVLGLTNQDAYCALPLPDLVLIT